MNLFFLYLISYFVINIAGFFIFGTDKQRAIQHKWRISEKTLWTIALIGGAAGCYLGMQIFRHKTKHASFRIGLPAAAIAHVYILAMVS